MGSDCHFAATAAATSAIRAAGKAQLAAMFALIERVKIANLNGHTLTSHSAAHKARPFLCHIAIFSANIRVIYCKHR